MDLLSDVIAVTRTGEPRSAKIAWHAPWSHTFDPVPGAAGFQVILHGSCWLIRPDEQPLELREGDVIFMAHGQGHTLCSMPESHATGSQTVTLCGAYELDPAGAHPLLLTLPETIHLPTRLGIDLRLAVELLSSELTEPRLGTDALVPALLESLLVYILRTWFSTEDSPPGWAHALRDPVIASALHAMHSDPARPWTVATLASVAGLSRAPFARRFASKVGQPPLTYLTWWRMTIAAQLLRETTDSLAVIAEKVGYASEFAFSTAFKRQFGLSPGKYRRGPSQ
ncbi:AraC family transcriptional regulator [Kibdelosporangium philippinense]|uniref:AraC family transcriptional regulator n=1 Tax=Kibdelosporangium philippinense TaxID=211113 RepID=A0ABS8ZAJ9_9PSEU|nr:AraC family transcriptional regulator [Kibdelosporangium philippinense]MCE7004835.1 AraC family transcriptional regulator [Kibdelosporangium philippinense]